MIGRRLEQIGRALVRPLTFETIVAPAIADLQFEASGSRSPRARGYIAVVRALSAAWTEEVRSDTAGTVVAMSLALARFRRRTAAAAVLAAFFPTHVGLVIGAFLVTSRYPATINVVTSVPAMVLVTAAAAASGFARVRP